MDALAEELRRAIDVRIAALEARITELQGVRGTSSLGLASVLKLLALFPPALASVVDAECQRNPNPHSRVQLLRPLLRHLTEVRTFVDSSLCQVDPARPYLALLSAVQRACQSLGIGERESVISVGSADNFVTFTRHLDDALFGPLGPTAPTRPPELAGKKFVIMETPSFEGSSVSWLPIVLGHELGHLAVNEHRALAVLNLPAHFDLAAASAVPVPGHPSPGTTAALNLLEIAQKWAVELMCDAAALRAFGAPAVAALGEYLEVIGATDALSETHPPGRLRIRLLIEWLGPVLVEPRMEQIVAPWRALAQEAISYSDPWADFLVKTFLALPEKIMDVVSQWAPVSDSNARSGAVFAIARLLGEGIPGSPTVEVDDGSTQVVETDVVTACWVARSEGANTPVEKLARKAIENLEFLRRWASAGGESAISAEVAESEVAAESGVLSAMQIRERTLRRGDNRLVVTPLLPGFASGTGLDVRLGNQFIVFDRSRTESFDALGSDDPRVLQSFIELPWGDSLVLHPHELILATTLEYFVFPADLSAQVITRSSYGRVGLLSATAVQVHPRFHGCLTLELVNLGTVPLVLLPGERIAQLVFSQLSEAVPPTEAKYRWSTGPEFSEVRRDPEADVLRRLRPTH